MTVKLAKLESRQYCGTAVGQHMTGLQPIVANFKDNFHVSMDGNRNSKWVHLNGIHYDVRKFVYSKEEKKI
jgi:hypothetical protein